MRCIFIIFVMIATQVIHAQDRIRYIFPDSIEKELINYCYHRLESNPNICLYIITTTQKDLLGCGAAREGSYKRSILIIDAQPVAVYHRKKKSILINRNSSINCD